MSGPTPGWIYSLTDPLDAWMGDDKLAHLFGAAALWAGIAAHWGARPAWLVVLGIGMAIEGIETVRYQRWTVKQFPMPWPFLCDKVSLKDLVADLLGAGIMALALRGHP